MKLNKRIPPEMLMTVQTIDDPSRLADTIVVHLTSIKLNDRQEILETTDPGKRLERLFELMNAEIEILQVGEEDPLAREEADGEEPEGILPE